MLQSFFCSYMFVKAYINTAKEILESYTGEEPFSSFLKKFFTLNKKFGSRDRKQVAHLCFCFFRLGKSLHGISIEERILVGFFLCSSEKNAVLEKLKPEWNGLAETTLQEKIDTIKQLYSFDVENIFSFRTHLSQEIEFESFSSAMLLQPETFLRLRPGKEIIVQKKLGQAQIFYKKISGHCLAVAPATKLDEIIRINEEVVVQDLSSQKVLLPLLDCKKEKVPATAWDCCAASGGKSILLRDYYPNTRLTVSDVRKSILINLHKRFGQAGIKNYHAKLADVGARDFELKQKFDLIICDVPCTGSGTWGRTPEQLYFFEEKKIGHYAALQKKIVHNASKSLKKDSCLLYITCSVFKEENEEAVEFIQEQLHLQLISQNYFKGYNQRADTLFAALFVL